MQSGLCTDDGIMGPVRMPNRGRLVVPEQADGWDLACGCEVQWAAVMTNEQADGVEKGSALPAARHPHKFSVGPGQYAPAVRLDRDRPWILELLEHGYRTLVLAKTGKLASAPRPSRS